MLKARGEVPALQRETETVDIGAPLSGDKFQRRLGLGDCPAGERTGLAYVIAIEGPAMRLKDGCL
jgi:hypothetical protein